MFQHRTKRDVNRSRLGLRGDDAPQLVICLTNMILSGDCWQPEWIMRKFGTGLATAILLASATAASAGEASKASFGSTPDGKDVTLITLTNGHGITAKVLSLGAALYALDVPDRNGKPGDIVLGYPDLKGTFAMPQYFGDTVGRYANRIAKGK